ncbi:MAG: inner membrane-spanning protein YciB [Marinovum algicola]|jgi:intracellular septation protein|uniref:Inner membrane-spanning protein YciB n=1 Tax=Marinovum algicola TaxID=42444 RepID=A0A975ZME1_9RHOB|nr:MULTISPECIES: inner membrane-spanning protein YciB [Marinovum]AKO96233.1 Intracellular septation protein A [Marinovum algicola DG 898]MDD9738713.1 septation protein IspZ [Marinovum sp. SP66]MDD9746118.1 septation protein IspZ [Marinovum sp. PR37]SEI94995.1 intracellular septation protein [Marinovum algicola]SLN10657.1 Intracellular septation protein [Marinovum algicola]
MTEKREINPVLKQVLELGPPLAFFGLYLWLKEDVFLFGGQEYSGFIVATVVFVPIVLLAMAVNWALTRELSRMQVFTAIMVIFFGALTAWFNDERFFKMKTTLVYGFFALLLGIGLLRGRSYLAYLLSDAVAMQPEGWMILTRRICLGFLTLAVANEVVWRTMSTDVWVKIETFGFPIALFAFIWAQFAALHKYMDLEDDKG